MINNDSFYNPTAGREADNRTYIPGMKRKASGASGADQSAESQAVRIDLQTRPVAGVLFSVSRDNCGELFPVYIGRNTIGNSPQSDVYLSEASVAPEHALILIRKIEMPDGSKKITMTISDTGSEFGTFVNNEELEDDIVPIKAGDIIRIGSAYNFQFVPLDADIAGLFKSTNFRATPRVENRPVVTEDYRLYMVPRADEKVYPNVVGEEDEFTFYGRTKEKTEDHSSKKTL